MTTGVKAALFALAALVVGLIMASLTLVVIVIATHHHHTSPNEQQIRATYTYKPGTVVYVRNVRPCPDHALVEPQKYRK